MTDIAHKPAEPLTAIEQHFFTLQQVNQIKITTGLSYYVGVKPRKLSNVKRGQQISLPVATCRSRCASDFKMTDFQYYRNINKEGLSFYVLNFSTSKKESIILCYIQRRTRNEVISVLDSSKDCINNAICSNEQTHSIDMQPQFQPACATHLLFNLGSKLNIISRVQQDITMTHNNNKT